MFAAAGFDDIAIAYPVVGEAKWRRIAELAEHARITRQRRQRDSRRGLSAAASAAGVTVHVQIDLDSGFGRCGVPTDDRGDDRQARAWSTGAARASSSTA